MGLKLSVSHRVENEKDPVVLPAYTPWRPEEFVTGPEARDGKLFPRLEVLEGLRLFCADVLGRDVILTDPGDANSKKRIGSSRDGLSYRVKPVPSYTGALSTYSQGIRDVYS